MNPRLIFRLTLLCWPVGLVLVLGYLALDAAARPLVILLAAGYAVGVCALVRFWRARGDRTGAALVALGPILFAMVGFGGPPTSRQPGLAVINTDLINADLINTAALMILAVALLLVVILIVADHRGSAHLAAAVPGLVLLIVGSLCYLANLVARLAVVLSGTTGQPAAVEGRGWVAYGDLLQVSYCATTYLCLAGLAELLRREGLVAGRAGTVLAQVAVAGTTVVVLGVLAAAILPRTADLIPAWAIFVLTIPVLTTLGPFALGLATLRHRSASWPQPRGRAERGQPAAATLRVPPLGRTYRPRTGPGPGLAARAGAGPSRHPGD